MTNDQKRELISLGKRLITENLENLKKDINKVELYSDSVEFNQILENFNETLPKINDRVNQLKNLIHP